MSFSGLVALFMICCTIVAVVLIRSVFGNCKCDKERKTDK